VTAKEAASGRYRVEDVVLPLPGSRVRYPCARGIDASLYARLSASGAVLAGAAAPGGAGDAEAAAEAAAAHGGVALALSAAQRAAQAEHERRGREAGLADEYARALDDAYAAAVGLRPGSAEAAAAAAAARAAVARVAAAASGGVGGRGGLPPPPGVDPAFTQAGLTGDYRRLVHVPRELSWRLVRYSDPDDDTLTETDMDRAMGHRGAGGKAAVAGSDGGDGPSSGGGGNGDGPLTTISGSGPLLALDLSFDLPPSCYATMLVRELTKACTGKGAHAELSRRAASATAAAATGATAAAAGEATETAAAP